MLIKRFTGLLVISFLIVGVFPALISTYGISDDVQGTGFFEDISASLPDDKSVVVIPIDYDNRSSDAMTATSSLNFSFTSLFTDTNDSDQRSWYIQTGTFSNAQNAQLQASGIGELGVEVEIIQEQLSFKVWVGPYSSRADADSTLLLLSSYGYPVYIQETL
jgi:hypothetical protein